MIIDTINNIDKYTCLHPAFAAAFAYIKNTDLLQTAPGTYEVNENVKAIITDNPGKERNVALQKFECHNKAIDIQLCIRGNEQIAWKPRETCVSANGGYDAEKDVLFYNDLPDMDITLHDGQFAVFFPEDVHAPMIGEGFIKKLVMKVKI